MSRPFEIAGRRVAPGKPCYLIAEAGVNHNGSIKSALCLVDAAADAGADAVKFQTFVADRIISPSAEKAAYQKKTTGESENQLEMVRRLELSETDFIKISDHCRERSIQFLSTPFDEQSTDLLERIGVSVYKIPSGELTNLPFLAHTAGKNKPLIVSTGMAGMREVREAVETIRSAGDPPLVLLHCVSGYPAEPAEANLRAMKTLASEFGVPAGFSDHTRGIEVSLAAAALGACVLEKHFTLDRSLPGPDHACSLGPEELKAWVRGVRTVESCLGDGKKEPVPSEKEISHAARKSLVAIRRIPAGSRLTEDALALKRPGTGLPPSSLPQVLGKTAKRDIPAGSLLALDMLS